MDCSCGLKSWTRPRPRLVKEGVSVDAFAPEILRAKQGRSTTRDLRTLYSAIFFVEKDSFISAMRSCPRERLKARKEAEWEKLYHPSHCADVTVQRMVLPLTFDFKLRANLLLLCTQPTS
jgi:hypothetical protein